MAKVVVKKGVGKNGIGFDTFDIELELTKMELSEIGIEKMESTPCLINTDLKKKWRCSK